MKCNIEKKLMINEENNIELMDLHLIYTFMRSNEMFAIFRSMESRIPILKFVALRVSALCLSLYRVGRF